MSNATVPLVAVIIPHYEDVVRLDRCLAALSGDPVIGSAEVVVVDNASTADVASVTRRFPFVRLVVETARGAAMARNRGVRETSAPRLFFLDSDCIPDPGWIAAGVAALNRAEVVGGDIWLFEETPPPRSGVQAFETVFAFRQQAYVERKGFSVSANLLTWRAVFEKAGGFVAGLSEDVDWCHRATATGSRLIYAPEVRVAHPTRTDMEALARKWRRMTAETFEIVRQRPAGRVFWALRGLAVLGSAVVHAPNLLRDPRLRDRGERCRGLLALAHIRAMRAGWMLRQALIGTL